MKSKTEGWKGKRKEKREGGRKGRRKGREKKGKESVSQTNLQETMQGEQGSQKFHLPRGVLSQCCVCTQLPGSLSHDLILGSRPIVQIRKIRFKEIN